MKTKMFSINGSLGTEIAVIREDKMFKLTINGKSIFQNKNYESVRSMILGGYDENNNFVKPVVTA
jgi:hypothetical protein